MTDTEAPTETIALPTLDRWLWIGAVVVVIGTGTLMAIAVPMSGVASVVGLLLGLVTSFCGVLLAARCTRVAVHLSPDTLHYAGFVRSLRIPRAGIEAVLDDATVEWRDADGRQHRRQLGIFMPAYEDDGTVFARHWRWRRAGLLRVREWAAARST